MIVIKIYAILLFCILLLSCPAQNFTDAAVECQNCTQLYQNVTIWASNNNNNNTTNNNTSHNNSNNNENFWNLLQIELIHVAIIVLLLHVMGVLIYSYYYCKSRGSANRRRRFRPVHLPNEQHCPCEGCETARQMLRGLVLQHLSAC